MRKFFPVLLTAAAVAGLSACAAHDDDFYAYPDDYRVAGNHRGTPDDYARARAHRGDPATTRYRSYDSQGDRDGDGVLNWRDRYPDDPRRF